MTDNTNFAELMRNTRTQAEIDSAMLQSMAASLRSGMMFSFNNIDMADMLDRLRDEHLSHLVD